MGAEPPHFRSRELPEATKLFLVTPTEPGADFEREFEAALAAGGIAAVLIDSGASEEAREHWAQRLVPLTQSVGAAAIVADYTRVAGRMRADGIQIGSGIADIRAAIASFRPGRIVGAAGIGSRHAAMEAGEAEPDYLVFGRPQGDTHPQAHPKALDLAQWWSELTSIPAVLMAGSAIESVAEAARTGAAFVGVNRAVWEHPAGAAAAVELARAALERRTGAA